MPRQEEHDKPENLVEAPHEAEHSARSLEDAVDSNATLEGYYAMNEFKSPEQKENEADEAKETEERLRERRKGHSAP
ncbi:MAG TPA: hypothetical protein VFB14_06395 [Bryobacteraceae bacterium]|jgi:hypothetical protein|nr:hypothetical protein [Bryobacteraceae bacterium]